MFIIEHRTAGVLVALLTPAIVAILGSLWDRLDTPAAGSNAAPTAVFASNGHADNKAGRP